MIFGPPLPPFHRPRFRALSVRQGLFPAPAKPQPAAESWVASWGSWLILLLGVVIAIELVIGVLAARQTASVYHPQNHPVDIRSC